MCIKTNFMKMSDLKYSKSIWWFKYCIYFYMNCHMTKPTKWSVRVAKTQTSLGIIRADAQTDLCLLWAHMSFCWCCRTTAHIIIMHTIKIRKILTPSVAEQCGFAKE